MKKIYFVRHCSAYGQHIDSPLTKDGIQQSQMLADYFSRLDISFDKIISSPYLRAIESLKPFANEINKPIEIDNRLKERILSEDPIDDWLEILEQSFQDYTFTLPGGESSNDVLTRSNQVLEKVLSDDSINQAIIVSHGNLLALLFSQYDKGFGFEQWKELKNPDVYLLEIDKDVLSFTRVWDS